MQYNNNFNDNINFMHFLVSIIIIVIVNALHSVTFLFGLCYNNNDNNSFVVFCHEYFAS